MKKKFVTFLVFLLLLGVTAAFALSYFERDAVKDPSDESQKEVNIEEGSSADQIARTLQEAGIINSRLRFSFYTRLHQNSGSFKAGIFAFSPSMSFSQISSILREGIDSRRSFTIPEGMTVRQVAAKLAEQGVCDEDAFLKAVSSGTFSYPFLTALPEREDRLEGYLFPDTYSYKATDTPEDIIRMMLDRFTEVFTEEDQAAAQARGYTVDQIVTVASIIEKEVFLDQERPLVASVIYNRLDASMPLGMCSTIHYIYGTNDEITVDQMNSDSPYNTYRVIGLPPGPIACPGKAALQAALHPQATNYLYFVLSPKGDGSANFSADYEEFLRDKEAYYDSLS